MIAEKSKAPKQADILACTAVDWCGKNFKVSSFSSTGKTDPNNKKAFISGQEYNLSFICSKDLPSPLFYSPISTVDLSIPNKPSQNQNSVVDPSPTPVPLPSNSTFINLSFNFLLIFLFILF